MKRLLTFAIGMSVLLTALPLHAAFYLHGTGPNANPPTLLLDNNAPTATTEKYRDSTGVNFSGGNLWKEIGTWQVTASGTLTELNNLHVWLGLKNSDDIGTPFDLRAEVYKNGQSLITSGELYCIQDITRNPALAKEVVVSFSSFSPVNFLDLDTLSLKIFTRIGTSGDGTFCGGHSNAVGLRLYFDATSRPSRFDATFLQNLAPVANAGQDQQVKVGDLVTLDGRNSYDPDGHLITYNWAITEAPSGSSASLSDPASVMPTFVPDVPGNYLIVLTVNDGQIDSSPDDVVVIAAYPNVAPTAIAGPDQSVVTGSQVLLDGHGSFDPDGNPLTYQWQIISLPEGSIASLDNSASPTPSFLADQVGQYVIELTVNDGWLNSFPDDVVVISATPNAPPVAYAGDDQIVARTSMIRLNASGSYDPDNNPLSYNWSIVSSPEGSTSQLDDPASPTPTILADREGDYVFRLVVYDGQLYSEPSTVVVRVVEVIPPNQNPVANPGGPYSGVVGMPVQFNGAGSSDPDGDPITFTWNFGDGSTGSGVTPTHTYLSAGTYTVTITVEDGRGGSNIAQTTAQIDNPVPILSSISPSSVVAGSPDFTLTLNGDNFVLTSIVSFNNQQYPTTYISKTKIEATIPASAVATEGTYPVKVINPAPGGGESSPLIFTVQPSQQPPETPQSGYINGRVFDVSTRMPLPGVLIMLRDVQGAVLTNGEGQFSFPTPNKGRYLLTTEKAGYAYGQRWVEVISQRDMVVDPLYLMALDSQVTTITPAGGTHLSADGKVEVVIPAGAVSAPIEVVTTDVMKSESLPAPLPPTSLFTYCVNLRPDDATFATQVRVRIKNYLNFPAGTPIPVGFYSKTEARWLNHGMSYVTGDGQWVEFYTNHFSWYDCNSPGLTQRPPSNIERKSRSRNQVCEESKDYAGSRVGMKSGNLGIEHKLPSYRSLGVSKERELVYNSTTAKPSAVISYESEIDTSQTTVPPTITYNLRMEGNMVAKRFIGERGKAYWGYLFDGINGRGQRLSTGIYPYKLDLSYDYSTTYARANFFGGPALDSTGVPTRETIPYTTSLDDFLVISNQIDSPFGAGWSLRELNRLHVQPDGNLVLVEGNGNASAVFKRDDISNPLTVDEHTIALYRFDGRENKAADATGRFEGTFYGEGHLVTEGKFGAGATFDGHGDYIRLGNIGAPPEGAVEAWVYFPNDPQVNNSFLMIATGSSEYGGHWDCPFDLGVHYGWGGDLRFGLWISGWRWAASGVTPAQLRGGWHHIAGTWGGRGIEIWIDGERKGYNPYTGGFQCTNYATVLVGTGSWVWDFNGIIDEFRFSSIQRSPGMASYSPLNDHSLIVRNADGTYTRTLKDGTKINFNAVGLHTSTVDRNGNTTTYTYNENGLLTSITDPTGLITAFAYDGNGRLSSITDPAGRITQVNINAQGDLVSVTNPDSTTVNYTYDADHLLVGKTDPRGFTTQYVYNDHHRMSETRTPDGGTVLYRPYDVQGLINDLPEGVGTFDNPAPLIKPSDIQVSKTDARGQTTYYKANTFGTFDEINDPLGRVTRQEFDKASNLTKIIRPDGSQILMTYDAKGNVLTRTDPLNHITRFTYEPNFNRITSITDPLNKVTNFGYDGKGNLTTITNALGKVTNITYDARGLMTSITDPLVQVTTFEYDARGNLSSRRDPLGNISAFIYDAAGNTTSMTDAEGKTTQYQYDQQNRLVQVTNPLSGTTIYGYQTGCPDCGRSDLVTSLTDANGNTTGFSYDGMGRVIRITDPLGFQKLFSYDPNGNLLSSTDPNGNTINYAYDWANRLIGKTMPGDAVSYGYDAVDNLTSAADNDSSISMAYDAGGRLTSVTTGGSVLPVATISYAYDASGNRISMVDIENGVSSYQYDSLNQLISLTNPQAETVSFTYDFLNRRTGLTLPNGVHVGYSYDSASRLLSLVHQITGANFDSFSYTYDRVGNRTSMTDLSGTHSYGYDQLYRLISATHPQPANPAETYTYDPVGNRLSSAQQATWGYDPDNRLLSYNGTSFTYDNNGNMISRTDQTGTTTYQYDAQNRLIGINKPDGAMITYRYDSFGRRIEKNVNGTVTRYLYDGEDILYESDGSNNILARYTHGPGIDEPLIMERGGSSYYYHADGLGSITRITDAAGNIVQSYVYSAFGEIVDQGGNLPNPYTYTSREFDPESGLYYYRARYYDAEVGRFLQTDPIPIGFAGGDVNLYVYVQNNPINFFDPYGLRLCRTSLPGLGNTYLDDAFSPLVQNWINANTASGINVIFTEAFRTTAYQEALANNPNAITPAAGGTSLHEAGFAVDISWSQLNSEQRNTVAQNAINAGLSWGGNFSTPDPVHFYHDPGNRSQRIQEAQQEYRQGVNCYCP